jgi:hypothetical protein
MKFLNFHLLQRQSYLWSEEYVLSNRSQQGIAMLHFDSWGYESVIRCYRSSLLPFIRIPHTLLKGRIHYSRAAYSRFQEIYWLILFFLQYYWLINPPHLALVPFLIGTGIRKYFFITAATDKCSTVIGERYLK